MKSIGKSEALQIRDEIAAVLKKHGIPNVDIEVGKIVYDRASFEVKVSGRLTETTEKSVDQLLFESCARDDGIADLVGKTGAIKVKGMRSLVPVMVEPTYNARAKKYPYTLRSTIGDMKFRVSASHILGMKWKSAA